MHKQRPDCRSHSVRHTDTTAGLTALLVWLLYTAGALIEYMQTVAATVLSATLVPTLVIR